MRDLETGRKEFPQLLSRATLDIGICWRHKQSESVIFTFRILSYRPGCLNKDEGPLKNASQITCPKVLAVVVLLYSTNRASQSKVRKGFQQTPGSLLAAYDKASLFGVNTLQS
jgi:hypothetical protein